jgi:hypothetical protein
MISDKMEKVQPLTYGGGNPEIVKLVDDINRRLEALQRNDELLRLKAKEE